MINNTEFFLSLDNEDKMSSKRLVVKVAEHSFRARFR